jgi:hypothetical protein
MKVDVDFKERIRIIAMFLLQSYKVLMGSLLLLFVPQECGDELCTMSQSLSNDNILYRISLIINFITVGFFALTYFIELRRENYCVNKFDIDHNVADNNLSLVLKEKPFLLSKVQKHNKRYYYVTISTFIIYFINFILSTIILVQDNIFLSTGLTPYLSYIILILMKLYDCYCISSTSIKEDKALSSYMVEFTSFNVIDPDKKDKIELLELKHKDEKNNIEV